MVLSLGVTLHFLRLGSGSAGAEVKVPWVVAMEVSVGKVEKGIVLVLETFSESLLARFQTDSALVGPRLAFCSSVGVMRCWSAMGWGSTSALLVVMVMP